MDEADAQQEAPGWEMSDDRAWRWVLLLAAGITALRLLALFATPLQLYPDEAQYWLWAQTPDWGYASKPPMIAWLIWLTTRAGDAEVWVRLSAPLLHGAAALALFAAARRLYGPAAGLLAAVLWLVTPAVLLSATFIATDAPLVLFEALALWAYAALLTAGPSATGGSRRRVSGGLGLGAAVGLAFLSKQAALYVVIGLVIHAAFDRRARRAWQGWAWLAAILAFAAVIAPNIAWQASHHFATVTHTAQVNAGLGDRHVFRPLAAVSFLAEQFGVFGPAPLILLLALTAAAVLRRRASLADAAMLALALPPLLTMVVFSAFHHAQANWAASGYPAAAVLVAGWIVRRRALGWALASAGFQALLAALFVVAVCVPTLADAARQSASLKRLRGWPQTAAFVARQAAAEGPLTAVVVEDRSLFNELAYYGRATWRPANTTPLRMRPPSGRALNQAELTSALKPSEGGRVLIVEMAGPQQQRLPGEFLEARPAGRQDVRLDRRHVRTLTTWTAAGYRGPVNARSGAG